MDNRARAELGRNAINAGQRDSFAVFHLGNNEEHIESARTGLSDMLANAMHYADVENLDFNAQLDSAVVNFMAEKNGED